MSDKDRIFKEGTIAYLKDLVRYIEEDKFIPMDMETTAYTEEVPGSRYSFSFVTNRLTGIQEFKLKYKVYL